MAGGSGGGHGATAGVWIAVAIIIAGTIISGIALIEWVWWLFWVGIGMVVGGSGAAFFAGIMDSVTEFTLPPAAKPESS